MSRTLLRIGQRIGAGYLVLLVLIFALGGAGTMSVRMAAQATEGLYLHPFNVTNDLSDLRRSILAVNGDILGALAFPERAGPALNQEIAQLMAEGDRALALAGERYLGPKEDFVILRGAWGQWSADVATIAGSLAQGDMAAVRGEYDANGGAQFQRTLDATDTMLLFARNKAAEFYAVSVDARHRLLDRSVILLAAALVIGGLMVYWVTLTITKPLLRLQRDMKVISCGSLEVTVSETDRNDEIGDMARQLEKFRNAAQDKRRTELKFSSVFRSSPDVLAISDLETGEILEINEGFSLAIGYTAEEAIGRSTLQLEIWESPGERRRVIDALGAKPRPSNVESALRRKDGTKFPVLMSMTRLALGERQCLLVVARDISDRKRDEEELRLMIEQLAQTNMELERFAEVAVHDLQEPSRIICSYAQLLERRYAAAFDDEGREYLGFLIGGANRMRDLVRGLQSFSGSSARAVAFAAVDMAELARAAAAGLAEAIENCGAVVEIAKDLPTVLGDRAQLHQSLSHILGNALKFRAEGRPPRITIDAVPDGAHWVFVVSDNGIGIPSEFAARVFEIFRRLHSPGRYPGAGVGLTLCKRVIEAHGGRIWLTSASDEGTKVHFTLPAYLRDPVA